jgi:Tfp pilus assembly protein PilO
MASFFDKLNLRPQERRFVVIAITIIVVVVSVLFIFPRFKDWGKVQDAKALARATLLTNQTEIARVPQYQTQLEKLQRAGSMVLPAEQAVDLTRTVQSKAQEKGVAITGTRPASLAGSGGTNQFFDEQAVSLDVSALDQEMVDYLVSLGSGDSMIRVRDMDLRPDPPQYRLLGKLTLVASYQKKARAAAAGNAPRTTAPPPAATAPPTPAPKPATNVLSTPKGPS